MTYTQCPILSITTSSFRPQKLQSSCLQIDFWNSESKERFSSFQAFRTLIVWAAKDLNSSASQIFKWLNLGNDGVNQCSFCTFFTTKSTVCPTNTWQSVKSTNKMNLENYGMPSELLCMTQVIVLHVNGANFAKVISQILWKWRGLSPFLFQRKIDASPNIFRRGISRKNHKNTAMEGEKTNCSIGPSPDCFKTFIAIAACKVSNNSLGDL